LCLFQWINLLVQGGARPGPYDALRLKDKRAVTAFRELRHKIFRHAGKRVRERRRDEPAYIAVPSRVAARALEIIAALAGGKPAASLHAPRLSPLTDSGQAALWVHGHVHCSSGITRPGGTRMVCNAAGRGFSNLSFQDDWVVEV